MKKEKLKNLLSHWPANTIAVSPWLLDRGISPQLVKRYLENGWIQALAHGAYIKKGDHFNWQSGIYALQEGLNLKIHVGGLTALDILGESHFISQAKFHLHLFNSGAFYLRRLLPKWLSSALKQECLIHYHRTVLFKVEQGLQDYDCGNFKILISSRERALLEILSLVPKKMSFDHVVLLFQGKSTLRVDVLQTLLEASSSQQTNRLFLYLAKHYNYPFLAELNLKTISLGKGKRIIGEGSVFDDTLNLYVPKINNSKDQMLGI